MSVKSKKQTVVATSSAAAEYYALAACVEDVIHIRNILEFLGVHQVGGTKVCVDSTAAKAIAERQASDTSGRSKSIDISSTM